MHLEKSVIRVAMHQLTPKGVGDKIGYVTLSDTAGGLLLEPEVCGLSPGQHGFHIHEVGDVKPKDGTPGGMAGEHYDPEKTGKHLGPYRDGHRGDLPRLTVDSDGVARTPVRAPRLTLDEVKDRRQAEAQRRRREANRWRGHHQQLPVLSAEAARKSCCCDVRGLTLLQRRLPSHTRAAPVVRRVGAPGPLSTSVIPLGVN